MRKHGDGDGDDGDDALHSDSTVSDGAARQVKMKRLNRDYAVEAAMQNFVTEVLNKLIGAK